MLEPTPHWRYVSKRPLTQWYGHVHLLKDHVVGQWFCLDRESGNLNWVRTFYRPNSVEGFSGGIIVATETRSDGPWTASFGCYGISLETGRLLWTSHASGVWGRTLRVLDFVPGFTNEFRDTPCYVEEGKVFCASGRVLDVQRGTLLEKLTPEAVQAYKKPVTLGQLFYRSHHGNAASPIAISNGILLLHIIPTDSTNQSGWKIAATTEAGEPLWTFSIEQLGRYIDGNFYSYRLLPPFLYLVVSEEPRYRPHPTKKHYVLGNASRWHLVTLDIATGAVLQDFSLGNEKIDECRIEDVDEEGLLISHGNHSLSYFRREGGWANVATV